MPPLPPGLKIEDISVGSGAELSDGSRAVVHFNGYLSNGTVFEDSRKSGKPIEFELGLGEVVEAWELGLRGMRVGGVRKIQTKAQFAYRGRGVEGLIPPHEDLVFEVELLRMEI